MDENSEQPKSRFPILEPKFRKRVTDVAGELVSLKMKLMITAALDGLKAIEKWEDRNPGYLRTSPNQSKTIKELGGKAFGLVSGADVASQTAVLETLASCFGPGYNIICEEKVKTGESFGLKLLDSSNYLSAFEHGGRVITVDALDGTTNYMLGGSEWTITLGLIENGVHTYGLVLNPVKGTIIFGGRLCSFAYNFGAVEVLIDSGGFTTLSDQRPVKTKAYAEGYDFQLSEVRKRFAAVLEPMGNESKCLMKAYSCANTLMDLLLGRVSLVFIPRQSIWDYSGALPNLVALKMAIVFFTFSDDEKIIVHNGGFESRFANPDKRVAGLLIGRDPAQVKRYSEILASC